MRKLIYSLMTSLDGFIAWPNGELDWVIVDEEVHTFVNDRERTLGAYLYGRRMYEVMSGYWPTAHLDASAPPFIRDYARIWQNIPKIVFSKTLEQVGPNTRLVRDNIAEEITQLKAQPGKDLALGGADLAATVMQLGLVDEYQLYIQPVVLGRGLPLFRTLDEPIRLRLVETHTFSSGVVFLSYARAEGA